METKGIGSEEHALAAVRIYAALDPHSIHVQAMPEGWRFLGEGTSRHVLLGPDGVVYKVDLGWEGREALCEKWDYDITDDDINPNVVEHRVASTLRSRGYVWLGKPLYVPRTSLFLEGRVLAMEYVDGDLLEDDMGIFDLEDMTRVDDLHGAPNVIVRPDGSWAIIDFHRERSS